MKKFLTAALLLAAFTVPAKAQAGSKTPRAVLEAYALAWNRHDFAAIDGLIAPDGIHEDIAAAVRAKGPEQEKDFMKSIISQEPDLKWHIDRVIGSGSSLAVEWTWTATFTGDGPYGPAKALPISGHGASIVVIENGRIKRFTDYYDTLSFFPKPPAKK